MTEYYKLLTGDTVIYIFIGFIIFSYLFVSLLKSSFIKPLKSFGISVIVVGVILIIMRLFLATLINLLPANTSKLALVFIDYGKSLLLNSCIICFVSGILLIIMYYIISSLSKKATPLKKESKSN